MKPGKTEIEIGKYVIELVMVGVFLGMVVSNWNANQHQNKLRAMFLSTMTMEL